MNITSFLAQKLQDKQALRAVFRALFTAVKEISDAIDISKEKLDIKNYSGDQQLKMDVLADIIVHDCLIECDALSMLASEERSEEVILSGKEYSVAYDPLDGSSLIDANFAIGSIFSIFNGTSLLGQTGQNLAGAMYAVYGPKTVVMLAFGNGVYEFVLEEGDFRFLKDSFVISDSAAYFAPGNLRGYNSNPGYAKLIDYWIKNSLTLRYSGGMVPDIHHMLIKGNGVFAYPKSENLLQGKLRLLYECIPMAYLVEQAGGSSTNGHCSILDIPVKTLHQTTPIIVGSNNEVERAVKFSV